MRHDQATELLGAYALDAVPDDEAATLARHLRECAECRRELDEHRETASLLAQVARLPFEEDLATDWASVGDGRRSQQGRRSMARRALVASVAAAVVAFAVLTGALVHQTRELDDARRAAESVAGDRELALRLGDEPGARRVPLSAPDDGVRAAAVLAPDGRAYLVDDTLPVLPEGKTYQLWAVLDGTRVSLGLLGGDPGVTGFRVPTGASWLAITAEDEPGVERSSMDPVVIGAV